MRYLVSTDLWLYALYFANIRDGFFIIKCEEDVVHGLSAPWPNVCQLSQSPLKGRRFYGNNSKSALDTHRVKHRVGLTVTTNEDRSILKSKDLASVFVSIAYRA